MTPYDLSLPLPSSATPLFSLSYLLCLLSMFFHMSSSCFSLPSLFRFHLLASVSVFPLSYLFILSPLLLSSSPLLITHVVSRLGHAQNKRCTSIPSTHVVFLQTISLVSSLVLSLINLVPNGQVSFLFPPLLPSFSLLLPSSSSFLPSSSPPPLLLLPSSSPPPPLLLPSSFPPPSLFLPPYSLLPPLSSLLPPLLLFIFILFYLSCFI